MSDTNFKKGEWITRLVDDRFAVMTNDTGYGICSTVMCDETDKANAHLIAAAPEMYEAIVHVLEMQLRGFIVLGDEVTYKLQKSLAKARGET